MWEEIKEYSWFSIEDFEAIEKRYKIKKGGTHYENEKNRCNQVNN